MHEVHYFQRFSKKEDVVTNNTLLLFNRLQHHNARVFEEVLREVLSNDDLVVGAVLKEQEESTGKTIADGVIRQRSFHIVLETKLYPSFNVGQLTGHLCAFDSSTAELEVLLLLAPQEPAHLSAAYEAVQAYNRKRNKSVQIAWTTFAQIVERCRDAIPEHERVMVEMLDDYEDFCDSESLLSKSDDGLLVVGCSHSLPDNLEFRLYYDPKQSHRPAKYIGFYKDKAIQAIGVLEKVVRVDRTKGGLQLISGGPLTADEKNRIGKAMDHAHVYGWDITRGCYFFLAGDVEPTMYRKHTKYPLRNRRYFDLRQELNLDEKKPLPDLKTLAKQLRDATW
ncbi:MAG: hypothetical protein HUU21_30045 [Polyangiaceae bacterium]|nr:hypothetical protein [Polyangiaceae bacterium]